MTVIPRERLIVTIIYVLQAVLSLLIALHCNLLKCYCICWICHVFLILLKDFTYLFNWHRLVWFMILVNWSGLNRLYRYTVLNTIKIATLGERLFIKCIPLQVSFAIQTFLHIIIAYMLDLKVLIVLNFYILCWFRSRVIILCFILLTDRIRREFND